MCIRDRRTPSNLVVRRRGRHLHKTWRRTHTSGASGTDVQAVPGPTQFKLRAPEPYAPAPIPSFNYL
eukprot:6079692-Alexandrium_andersonii.AAC.1